jgi:hypothetical protein
MAGSEAVDMLEVIPNGACVMRCPFCRMEKDIEDMTTEEVLNNAQYFQASKGIRRVLISGGEPTHRPDFLELVDGLRALSFSEIAVISTGRGFGEEGLVRRLNCQRVIISLTPGSLQEWRYGGFQAVLKGIGNLLRRGIRVQTNTLVTPENYAFLGEIAKTILEQDVPSAILTFPFPVGGVKGRVADLAPTFEQSFPSMAAFIDRFADSGRNVIVKGLPLCYLGARKAFTARTQDRYYVDRNRQFENAVRFLATELPFERFKACEGCGAFDQCDGFWRVYLERPGFPPVQRI